MVLKHNRREYRDRTVVISGAAGGLGRVLSLRFGLLGANLGIIDREKEALERLSRELTARGISNMPVTLDITKEKACQRALDSISEKLGGIYVLVNNAGISHRSAFIKTSSQVFRRVMDVNFFGSLYLTRAALPYLITSKGQIIVISSIAGFAPLLGRPGYAASKHALQGFFSSLRPELSPYGITITIACPGFTKTGIDKNALDWDGSKTLHPQSTLGKVADPWETSGVIINGSIKNLPFIIHSTIGRITYLMMKIAPGLYERMMPRLLRSELDRHDNS
jgi:NAD(P)-dependent dehydrogenase (short-subunit alcohol dehydrogenase family)